jgi:hypothetical protein
MPHPIEHKHAFGPRELNKLAQAFEGACRDLAEESNARTAEQLELTRITLAQWIITCATKGVVDVENVEQLKVHALLGLRWSTELGDDACSQSNIEHALKAAKARSFAH